MTDLESRLQTLEYQRMRLVQRRDEVITQAETMIDEANREFDRLAVTLGRDINELRARLRRDEYEAERTEQRRGRNSHKPPMLDGLDEDEQEHYQELLARRKKR